MAAQKAAPGGKRRGGTGKPGGRRSGASMPYIRLLPVTIFVAVLMLSVRVNDIWKGLSAVDVASLSINRSEAQQPPPPGGRQRGQRSPTPPAAAPAGASPGPTTATTAAAGSATPSATGSAAGIPPAAPSAAPSAAGEGEPPTFTQNEVDVLQKLSARREALEARQQDLDLRENMVKAAEARIDKKIAEMKALQANIQSMAKQVDDQDDGKMKSLVKIYENMKPKDAAKIFEQLDMPVLMGVMTHMKEQKVAPIMEAMDPMKAKTVTDSMAMRRASKAEGQQGSGG
jgi:flagellar motility protein MotE (MotC chaperone)